MDRAHRHPEVLTEIEQECIDIAHLSFIEMMKQKKDLNIKFKASRFYAQTKGKEQFNVKPVIKAENAVREQIIKIGNNVLKFFSNGK